MGEVVLLVLDIEKKGGHQFLQVVHEALEDAGIESTEILLLRIDTHLGSLGPLSRDSLVVGRASVKGFSREELIAIARKSTPELWSKKPGFFRALLDEIESLRLKPAPVTE